MCVCVCFSEDDSSWRWSVRWEEEEETRPETVKTSYLSLTSSSVCFRSAAFNTDSPSLNQNPAFDNNNNDHNNYSMV